MTKKEQIESFIDANSLEVIREYNNKLHENLSDLNSRESANTMWMIGVIFLYVILHNSSIESLQLGFISIKDSSIILKILPVVYIYFQFTLLSINSRKEELDFALNIISEHIYTPFTQLENKQNFIVRLFIPYTFADSTKTIYSKRKIGFFEAIIALLLLLPFLIIALGIYGIIIYMIFELWKNYSDDIIGKISLGLTIYMSCLLIYYRNLKSKSEEGTPDLN